MTKNEKAPAVGQTAKASKTSGADKLKYTPESDYWNRKDAHRVATDLTDFLIFAIEQYGNVGSADLAKAVHFVKRESYRLAFLPGVDHG